MATSYPNSNAHPGPKAFCLCHPQIKFEVVGGNRVVVTKDGEFVRHLELAGRAPDAVIREWFEVSE